MSVFEILRTAIDSLVANKLRTALTMLGVIIGVASVVTLLSIGAGVQSFVGNQLKSLGTNLITVSLSDLPNARLSFKDVEALADKKVVRGVIRAVPEVLSDLGEVVSGPTKRQLPIAGSPPEFFVLNHLQLAQGRWFTGDDVEARARVAVLGATVAEQLFAGRPAVGEIITLNGVSFEVIGVATLKGGLSIGVDDAVRVPITVAAEKLFAGRAGGMRSVTSITVESAPHVSTQSVINDITRALRRIKNTQPGQGDQFKLFVPSSLVNSFNTISTALTAFLGAIGAISLVVGGIGIMNIMLVSVTERTREIGVRKAIGASPASIRVQFLIEALTVTTFAGLIGIAIGVGAAVGLSRVQDRFQPVVQFSSVAIAFGVSVLIGVLFGLYPAWRASRLQPVEALRYE